MEEEKPKKKKIGIVGIIILTLLVVLIVRLRADILDIGWMIELGIDAIFFLSIIFWDKIKEKLGIKEREEKKILDLKLWSKEDLVKGRSKRKNWIIQSDKELEKRPKNAKEIIASSFEGYLNGTLIILLFGLFYLGAMPLYFGVNNEFINPINESFGLNNSMELVCDAGMSVINTFMNSCSSNPAIFFWLWWAMVFYIMILPILEMIWKLIKLKQKSNERRDE